MDITVIIPTYNEEKYIGSCLDSLNKQDYNGSYEIIVGDGNSTDKTHAICAEYGAKVVIEPKPTISAGRQKACEFAKGRIIVSTDADAKAPKEWLESITSNFNGNVALYGNIIPYDGSKYEQWVCKHVMSKYMQFMDAIGKPVPAGSNLAFKRKAFENVGGWNKELITAEDLDLVRKLKTQGTVSYNPSGEVYVSLRRVKKWGYLNYVSFHVSNAIKYHTTGKSHNTYERIR